MKYAVFSSSGKVSNDKGSRSCIIPISVGQPYHESEDLTACVELYNSTFNNCMIIVCDTLQRYTYKINHPGISEAAAYEQTARAGEDWIQRNQKYLEQLEVPFQITRWDQWLSHARYLPLRKQVDELYAYDKSFTEAVNSTAEKFYNRTVRRESLHVEKDFFMNHTLNYLLEECAVLPLWLEIHSKYIVYPKDYGKAILITLKKIIKPVSQDLLIPLKIKIKSSNRF
ncbi:MAG: tRNA-dependent cyclodipeptide synthase [Alphaproteobacteria bacterium]|nr:tRNA-dependent cyclodipeptide synthase [Alphaproteobacteria bacterium]